MKNLIFMAALLLTPLTALAQPKPPVIYLGIPQDTRIHPAYYSALYDEWLYGPGDFLNDPPLDEALASLYPDPETPNGELSIHVIHFNYELDGFFPIGQSGYGHFTSDTSFVFDDTGTNSDNGYSVVVPEPSTVLFMIPLLWVITREEKQ